MKLEQKQLLLQKLRFFSCLIGISFGFLCKNLEEALAVKKFHVFNTIPEVINMARLVLLVTLCRMQKHVWN